MITYFYNLYPLVWIKYKVVRCLRNTRIRNVKIYGKAKCVNAYNGGKCKQYDFQDLPTTESTIPSKTCLTSSHELNDEKGEEYPVSVSKNEAKSSPASTRCEYNPELLISIASCRVSLHWSILKLAEMLAKAKNSILPVILDSEIVVHFFNEFRKPFRDQIYPLPKCHCLSWNIFQCRKNSRFLCHPFQLIK